MFYVFDLDGTLANAEHRVHYIKQNPPDWESFLAAQDKDTPIQSIVYVLRALQISGHRVEIWTGRREDQRADTVTWLLDHGITVSAIRMRSNGDRREDFIVKEAYLKYGVPNLIFEDRTQMVKMWRSLGIRVAQVADGDY